MQGIFDKQINAMFIVHVRWSKTQNVLKVDEKPIFTSDINANTINEQ